MPKSDAQIGKNLARLRGDRSQKDVAEAMKARGWKWSQATAWSVEKGDRPLRLSEALDVAEILGTPVSELTRSGETVRIAEVLDDAEGVLSALSASTDDAANVYRNLEVMLERIPTADWPGALPELRDRIFSLIAMLGDFFEHRGKVYEELAQRLNGLLRLVDRLDAMPWEEGWDVHSAAGRQMVRAYLDKYAPLDPPPVDANERVTLADAGETATDQGAKGVDLTKVVRLVEAAPDRATRTKKD